MTTDQPIQFEIEVSARDISEGDLDQMTRNLLNELRGSDALSADLEIISKGILSQSAKPKHSAGKLKQGEIVFRFLFVTDQQAATLG